MPFNNSSNVYLLFFACCVIFCTRFCGLIGQKLLNSDLAILIYPFVNFFFGAVIQKKTYTQNDSKKYTQNEKYSLNINKEMVIKKLGQCKSDERKIRLEIDR